MRRERERDISSPLYIAVVTGGTKGGKIPEGAVLQDKMVVVGPDMCLQFNRWDP